MPDITITCQDCRQEFAWTSGEQQFYLSKGLPKPQYCLICRGKYQAKQKDQAQYQRKKTSR